MKDLEKENARLKKRVADQSPDKDILNEALRGNYCAPRGADSVYVMYNSRLGYQRVVPASPWDTSAVRNVEAVCCERMKRC